MEATGYNPKANSQSALSDQQSQSPISSTQNDMHFSKANTGDDQASNLEHDIVIQPRVMIVISLFWGIFGLHDFVLKRWWCGIGHLALALIGIFAPLSTHGDGTKFIIPIILLITSLVWMIFELHFYLKEYGGNNKKINYAILKNTFDVSNKLSIFFSIMAYIIELVIIWHVCFSISQRQANTTIYGGGFDFLLMSLLLFLQCIPLAFSWIFYSFSKNARIVGPKQKLFHIAHLLLLFLVILIPANIFFMLPATGF